MLYTRAFTLFVSLISVTSVLAAPSAAPVDVVERADEVLPRQSSSVLTIFQDLTTQGTPFINGLQSAVADPSNIDSDALTTNLQGIITLLTSSQSQLQGISKGPNAAAQSPESAAAVVGVFGPLLGLLLTVLGTVRAVILHTPLAGVVLPLLATIGHLLAAVITVAVPLVSGLLVAISPFLIPVAGILNDLGFTLILVLLGL